MNKTQVLKTMQTERANLESLLNTLSDAQMCDPSLDGQWAIKDVLAHIAVWEPRCVGWIQAALRGETPERPESGYEWDDIDRLNERTFLENRNRYLSDVLADSRQAYQQLLTQVQALSEEELTDPQQFAWTEGQPLVPYMAANSYEHYREHAEQIQGWKEQEKSH